MYNDILNSNSGNPSEDASIGELQLFLHLQLPVHEPFCTRCRRPAPCTLHPRAQCCPDPGITHNYKFLAVIKALDYSKAPPGSKDGVLRHPWYPEYYGVERPKGTTLWCIDADQHLMRKVMHFTDPGRAERTRKGTKRSKASEPVHVGDLGDMAREYKRGCAVLSKLRTPSGQDWVMELEYMVCKDECTPNM